MKKSKKPQNDTNVGTHLLSTAENFQIFELLGSGCTTKATTIVQLFATEPPQHNGWIKKNFGVLCLVKDGNLKKYFFRLYCYDSCTFLWEFSIPPEFEYVESASFLHAFQGKDCVYGFNFADDNEAKRFYDTVRQISKTIKFSKNTNQEKLKRRSKKIKQEKKPSRPAISNPVGFTHVQHYGFDDWRGLNAEMERLKGTILKNAEKTSYEYLETVTEEVVYTVPNETSNVEEVRASSGVVEFGDIQKDAYDRPTNFLSELNNKFESNAEDTKSNKEQHGEYEENASEREYESNQHELRQALMERRGHFYEEINGDDDDDDDDWDDDSVSDWD